MSADVEGENFVPPQDLGDRMDIDKVEEKSDPHVQDEGLDDESKSASDEDVVIAVDEDEDAPTLHVSRVVEAPAPAEGDGEEGKHATSSEPQEPKPDTNVKKRRRKVKRLTPKKKKETEKPARNSNAGSTKANLILGQFAPGSVLQGDEWQKYLDHITCFACKKGDNDDEIVLCEGCDASYHLYCLNPPLTFSDLPSGDWFCDICVAFKKSQEPEPVPEPPKKKAKTTKSEKKQKRTSRKSEKEEDYVQMDVDSGSEVMKPKKKEPKRRVSRTSLRASDPTPSPSPSPAKRKKAEGGEDGAEATPSDALPKEAGEEGADIGEFVEEKKSKRKSKKKKKESPFGKKRKKKSKKQKTQPVYETGDIVYGADGASAIIFPEDWPFSREKPQLKRGHPVDAADIFQWYSKHELISFFKARNISSNGKLRDLADRAADYCSGRPVPRGLSKPGSGPQLSESASDAPTPEEDEGGEIVVDEDNIHPQDVVVEVAQGGEGDDNATPSPSGLPQSAPGTPAVVKKVKVVAKKMRQKKEEDPRLAEEKKLKRRERDRRRWAERKKKEAERRAIEAVKRGLKRAREEGGEIDEEMEKEIAKRVKIDYVPPKPRPDFAISGTRPLHNPDEVISASQSTDEADNDQAMDDFNFFMSHVAAEQRLAEEQKELEQLEARQAKYREKAARRKQKEEELRSQGIEAPKKKKRSRSTVEPPLFDEEYNPKKKSRKSKKSSKKEKKSKSQRASKPPKQELYGEESDDIDGSTEEKRMENRLRIELEEKRAKIDALRAELEARKKEEEIKQKKQELEKKRIELLMKKREKVMELKRILEQQAAEQGGSSSTNASAPAPETSQGESHQSSPAAALSNLTDEQRREEIERRRARIAEIKALMELKKAENSAQTAASNAGPPQVSDSPAAAPADQDAANDGDVPNYPGEYVVIAILNQRHNPEADRVEFYTSWADGDFTWEPKSSFIDDDGVYTDIFVEYIRKRRLEREKELQSKHGFANEPDDVEGDADDGDLSPQPNEAASSNPDALIVNPHPDKKYNLCCHYCRLSRARPRKLAVQFLGCNTCSNTYCQNCITNLGLNFDEIAKDSTWQCNVCLEECCCCFEQCPKDHAHCFLFRRNIQRRGGKPELTSSGRKRRRPSSDPASLPPTTVGSVAISSFEVLSHEDVQSMEHSAAGPEHEISLGNDPLTLLGAPTDGTPPQSPLRTPGVSAPKDPFGAWTSNVVGKAENEIDSQASIDSKAARDDGEEEHEYEPLASSRSEHPYDTMMHEGDDRDDVFSDLI